MSDGMVVWQEALGSASLAWSDQADTLVQARSDVTAVEEDASTLGPQVSAAVATFTNDWLEVLLRLQESASGYSETLALNAQSYQAGDDEAAAALSSLLPWSERTTNPESP